MKRADYCFNYKFSDSGIKYVFGKIDGIPFTFPFAMGKSCAVSAIASQTGCTIDDAYDCYDAYILSSHVPVLGFSKYEHYLNDDSWKETRARALKRANYMCEICGATRCLDVHHLTYARIGHEDQDDLVVLCRMCHQKQHGRSF